MHVLRQSGAKTSLMVDAKNGDSFEGTLCACDTFMNMRLEDVTVTSSQGKFFKCAQVFVRGNTIKSVQLQPEVLSNHIEQVKLRQAEALEHRANKRTQKADSKGRGGFTGGRDERGGRGRGGFQARGRGRP